jgi:hypothetical protein
MQRLIVSFVSRGMMVGSQIAGAEGDTKAVALLKQARAALGGEGKLANVQGLSAAGTLAREIGDRQVTGELTIDLQLPDKMVRSDSMSPMGDATIVMLNGINGDTLLRHSKTLNAGPGLMIRMPPAPAAGSDAETQALRAARAELARFTVAFLLTSPASMPLEFSDGGEAESPDGKADVVNVKGPGSFAARLFFDKGSHRPLMLSYQGVAPRMVMQTMRGGPAPDAAAAQRRTEEGAAAQPTPQAVDIQMFLDDYRAEDGVLLPHKVSRSVDGRTTEEWTFKTIKNNPAFKADAFSGKSRVGWVG